MRRHLVQKISFNDFVPLIGTNVAANLRAGGKSLATQAIVTKVIVMTHDGAAIRESPPDRKRTIRRFILSMDQKTDPSVSCRKRSAT